MIHIDGSQGEGGGQILRSALALSMVTGQPVRFTNIRAGRKKPGLMRQHLTAVQAAAHICQAQVSGAAMGAKTLEFKPGSVQPGEYHFALGTAGSTTLVLQTVLPALMLANRPSQLSFEGGTHNPMAPCFDFLAETFLPVLAKMGPTFMPQLDCYGFYPAGGGRWSIAINPVSSLQPLSLLQRGKILERQALAIWAHLPAHIATRELKAVSKRLNWPEECLHLRELPAPQPGLGNCLLLRIQSEHITELFSACAERGVAAEKLARRCADQVLRYLHSGVPVGQYLADQLLLSLALAGNGEFLTLKPTRHALSNIKVIEQLLPVRFDCQQTDRDCWHIAVYDQAREL